MSRPKLLFVASEDWFFKSHFWPMLEAGLREGFDVVVAARDSGAINPGELGAARFIPAPFARGSLQVGEITRDVAFLRALLAREKPDVLHAIALKPIGLVLLAQMGAPTSGRVYAVTGRGFVGARRSVLARSLETGLRGGLRRALRAPRALLAVENIEDRAWVEQDLALPDEHVVLFPGAGVDAQYFDVAPEPDGPIVIGAAARLIWSKGLDIAVAALEILRARGVDAELHIAGAPDPENPGTVSESVLQTWRQTPGVRVLGRVADINAFWARAHIACAPSRGGEGLPRSMLEAAACGRPIVTTTTPGCRSFVESGRCGLAAAPDDPRALAESLRLLAINAELRAEMGAAGRSHVLNGYTTRHVQDAAAAAWRRALGGSH